MSEVAEKQASSTANLAALALPLALMDPMASPICLRGGPGPVRTGWLDAYRASLPSEHRILRLPQHASDDRLLGGLDIAATLKVGRPVYRPGLLSEADQQVLLVPMAERLARRTAGTLAGVIDTGTVTVERDGVSLSSKSRFGCIFLDEGVGSEEGLPSVLLERVGIWVCLDGISLRDVDGLACDAKRVQEARGNLPEIRYEDALECFCSLSLTLGVGSLRVARSAVDIARRSAAWFGRSKVESEDIELAASLVLLPRALPPPQVQEPPEEESRPQETASDANRESGQDSSEAIHAAEAATLPEALLNSLAVAPQRSAAVSHGGRFGELKKGGHRGRPRTARPGSLGPNVRLNLVDTLRAAAPWQRLRTGAGSGARLQIRQSDFRVAGFEQRRSTTAIFLVDASGSQAMHRLGEAKGAVQELLAQCYVRRDQVALLSFRGDSAEEVLPPTRSLARAKRSISGLPAGGATPLARGLQAGVRAALMAARRGDTPLIVLLTDGGANVTLEGSNDRKEAHRDAQKMAREIAKQSFSALVVDTSRRPDPRAKALADEMRATYLPLPKAQRGTLSNIVSETMSTGA